MSKPVSVSEGLAASKAAADAPCAAIPLAEVGPNREVVLAAIEGGYGLRHRLTEMGLRVGVRFVVRGGGKHGPFILGIGDTRLVIGHGMAHRVLVYLPKS